ncbi:MAG: hypothetical protein QMD99_22180, partial [Rhizobiaceae bacterium]|nr:hypothetical protein [Rhizobiaceae bacterium]
MFMRLVSVTKRQPPSDESITAPATRPPTRRKIPTFEEIAFATMVHRFMPLKTCDTLPDAAGAKLSSGPQATTIRARTEGLNILD